MITKGARADENIYAEKRILKRIDRLTISGFLVKAGYTVRLGKEKLPGKNTHIHFIEYFGDNDNGKIS